MRHFITFGIFVLRLAIFSHRACSQHKQLDGRGRRSGRSCPRHTANLKSDYLAATLVAARRFKVVKRTHGVIFSDLPLLYLSRFGQGWFVVKIYLLHRCFVCRFDKCFRDRSRLRKKYKTGRSHPEDNATNACWTNLKESREYAEEKLRGLGATLYDNEEKYYGHYYALTINVQSKRLDVGLCFGAISISLKTGIK